MEINYNYKPKEIFLSKQEYLKSYLLNFHFHWLGMIFIFLFLPPILFPSELFPKEKFDVGPELVRELFCVPLVGFLLILLIILFKYLGEALASWETTIDISSEGLNVSEGAVSLKKIPLSEIKRVTQSKKKIGVEFFNKKKIWLIYKENIPQQVLPFVHWSRLRK